MKKPERPFSLIACRLALALLLATVASCDADSSAGGDTERPCGCQENPDADAQSEGEARPEAEAQPDAEAQHEIEARYEIEVQPEVDVQSEAEVLPEAEVLLEVEPTSPCGSPAQQAVLEVSVQDLHDRLQAGDLPIAVVDVREPSETARGIVAGALLYPYNSGVLEREHNALPTDHALYVICGSGSRSVRAASFLFQQGHACVHNVLGGMAAWSTAGYPTVAP